METKAGYNHWAKTYDAVINKTRDLEGVAIRAILGDRTFERILEIGCGTGKNTIWLAGKCNHLVAADFSEEMLREAQMKITSEKIAFRQADITTNWSFEPVDLITCSLVLEHIENISFVFQQASTVLNSGGNFYICELHPYKQLQGSRAKFENGGNLLELDYFIHHISDYFGTAKQHGFTCSDLQEWFDDDDRHEVPRLVSFLFRKN